MNGNTHMPHECPYCWRVVYSKGALTYHVNEEHWKEVEDMKQELFLSVEKKPDAEFATALEDDNEPA